MLAVMMKLNFYYNRWKYFIMCDFGDYKLNINEEFERFIEFPGDSKQYVTSISAKLFAKHCVEKLETAIRETLDNNLHLADGDECTLIKLKLAINYI